MNCPECDGRLDRGACKKCGWGQLQKPAPSNGLKWWVSPPVYVKPSDGDVCGEPLEDGSGFCQRTVREHREEFKTFGDKIAKRVVRL